MSLGRQSLFCRSVLLTALLPILALLAACGDGASLCYASSDGRLAVGYNGERCPGGPISPGSAAQNAAAP